MAVGSLVQVDPQGAEVGTFQPEEGEGSCSEGEEGRPLEEVGYTQAAVVVVGMEQHHTTRTQVQGELRQIQHYPKSFLLRLCQTQM